MREKVGQELDKAIAFVDEYREGQDWIERFSIGLNNAYGLKKNPLLRAVDGLTELKGEAGLIGSCQSGRTGYGC